MQKKKPFNLLDEKTKIKQKDNRNHFDPLAQKKKGGSLCLFFFIESAGTDGARTRSFRLARPVRCPIALQSHGNQARSLHIPSYDFILIISILDSNYCFVTQSKSHGIYCYVYGYHFSDSK